MTENETHARADAGGIHRKTYALNVESTTDEGTLEGYASVFNTIDSQGDVIAPGAFKRTISAWAAKGRGVPVLWQHSSDEPIGVTTSITEDDHGLRVRAQLVREVRRANEAHALAKAGALGGLSIGFSASPNASDGKPAVVYDEAAGARVFREVRLWEYSLVTFPANEDAVLTSVKGWAGALELLEAIRDMRETHAATADLVRELRNLILASRALPPDGRAPSGVRSPDDHAALSAVLKQAQELLRA